MGVLAIILKEVVYVEILVEDFGFFCWIIVYKGMLVVELIFFKRLDFLVWIFRLKININ